MDIVLNTVVCFGLFSVGLAFVVLLPALAKLLIAVFTTVFVEQVYAHVRGIDSGTILSRPDKPPPRVEPSEEHGPASLGTYLAVYGALLVLTMVTVAVSELGLLMRDAVFWAVVVASIKASLVIAWFMHMKGGAAMNRLILSTSMFFVAVFFTLTMADLSTRNTIFGEEGQSAIMKEALDKGEVPAGWSVADPVVDPR